MEKFGPTTGEAGGAKTGAILPARGGPGGPEQNVTALPADNAAITIDGTAGAGATYGTNLAFSRDAVAFVTADLPLPPKKDASRMEYKGISLRVIQDYDTVNDMFLTRADILFGSNVIRPELAVRIANNPTLLTPP